MKSHVHIVDFELNTKDLLNQSNWNIGGLYAPLWI